MCQKDENQFQCPTNLPRLNVTLPTYKATRSAWVEKIKGLKFIKAQTQDSSAGITFLQSGRQEGINNVATITLFDSVFFRPCTDPGNDVCDFLYVDTKQGVFPGVYTYNLVNNYDLDIDTRVYNPEARAVEEYNNLVCQWQALIPELEKCPTGTHKS